MVSVKVKVVHEISLNLTRRHASFLKGILQNPLSESESEEDRQKRYDIFSALEEGLLQIREDRSYPE